RRPAEQAHRPDRRRLEHNPGGRGRGQLQTLGRPNQLARPRARRQPLARRLRRPVAPRRCEFPVRGWQRALHPERRRSQHPQGPGHPSRRRKGAARPVRTLAERGTRFMTTLVLALLTFRAFALAADAPEDTVLAPGAKLEKLWGEGSFTEGGALA